MKRLILVGFLVVIFPSIVGAEATSKIRYLMLEPASIFDLGLYRLEKRLSHIGSKTDLPPVTFLNYDWKANRITIGQNTLDFDSGREGAKKKCADSIRMIRVVLLVNYDTGDGKLTTHVFDRFFRHRGYGENKRPDNVGDELMLITKISVSVRYERGTEKTIKCNAPLLGKEISFILP